MSNGFRHCLICRRALFVPSDSPVTQDNQIPTTNSQHQSHPPGMWRREKNGGLQEKFFQNFRCIEKFFEREGDIYKILKSWAGGAKPYFSI